MKRRKLLEKNNPLNFKRWKRTRYAVFSSLKRVVHICSLSVIYFLSLGVNNAFAAKDSTAINKTVNLTEVEIAGRRTPGFYAGEMARAVTVLSRSQIELLPVQSVQELLRYIPGVDVRERSTLGVQADISIRGGSAEQVMILLNGVNITDPQTGHHAFNLPVDLQDVERIEVLQGSASRIYGPNAFSGAINIITSNSSTNKVSARVMGGQYGLYSGGAAVNVNTKSIYNHLSVQKSGSNGYIANTDFDILNLYYRGQLGQGSEQLSWQAGYTDKAFGANSFYSAAYPNQFEKTGTSFAALSFVGGELIKLRSNAYWRRHSDRYELFRNSENAAEWYTGHNYHLTDVFGANVNAAIPWQLGISSVGAEMRGESIWSNNLKVPITENRPVPHEKGKYFTGSYHRNNISVFVEHNVNIWGINLSGGLLLNKNSQQGFNFDIFPGIDASYRFSPYLTWMASYNQSLRLPTFTDLFYEGASNKGNAQLKAEESSTVETSLQWSSNWLNIRSTLFYREGKNLIDWGKKPDETVYITSNINSINAWGFETAGNIDFRKLLPNQKWLRILTLSYSHTAQNKEANTNYESAYVFDYLKNKMNIGVEHGTGINSLWLNWNIQYQDRAGSYTASATNSKVNYRPFWLTGVKINWKYKNIHLWGEASNLFNIKYADLGELTQPGRWLRVGCIFNLMW